MQSRAASSFTLTFHQCDYLRYKSIEKQSQKPSGNFLLSIAGLGTSAEKDISERDEDILAKEIDSIRGWSLHSDEQR